MMSAELLLGSLEAAQELGVDLTETLRVSRVSRQQLKTGEGVLPLHSVVAFLNDGAERFGCEHFGFLIGRHQPPARFAMIGQLIRFSATLEESINDAIRFSLLNSEYTIWRLEREGELATLIRGTRVAYDAPLMQLQTLAMVLVYKAIVAVCGRALPLRQVLFSHRAPAASRELEKFFGAAVSFDEPVTALVLHQCELQAKLPSHDPAVRRLLLSQLESLAAETVPDEDLVLRLRQEIKRSIGSRHCNLYGTCQRTGLHPRSLQRALHARGVTFKELLGDVRQELAEHYMRNSDISVIELSDMLGYSNASAFSRAFKQRVGLSPQAWKATLALPAP